MYTVGLQDHTCTAWCQPPEHAHLVLITPDVQTEAEVLASGIAEAYYAVHRRRILHARPAPEVDKERLVQEKTGQLGISHRLSVRRFPAEALQAMTVWLIHFRQEEPS